MGRSQSIPGFVDCHKEFLLYLQSSENALKHFDQRYDMTRSAFWKDALSGSGWEQITTETKVVQEIFFRRLLLNPHKQREWLELASWWRWREMVRQKELDMESEGRGIRAETWLSGNKFFMSFLFLICWVWRSFEGPERSCQVRFWVLESIQGFPHSGLLLHLASWGTF